MYEDIRKCTKICEMYSEYAQNYKAYTKMYETHTKHMRKYTKQIRIIDEKYTTRCENVLEMYKKIPKYI